MRKIRFFYEKNKNKWMLLLGLLSWLVLLNQAVERQVKEQSTLAQAVPSIEQDKDFASQLEEKGELAGIVQSAARDLVMTAAISFAGNKPDRIRVVLMDSGYESYYHSSVTLTCQGETVTLTPKSEELQNGSITYTDEAGITIESITRGGEHPVYFGTIEITRSSEGLLLINELPLEQYLEGVVPSEMPATYQMEALKAQAVCARTYARRQIEEKRMEAYGADVDDSVSCQVYLSQPLEETSTEAVHATEGQVLTQGGTLIEAYYFSTSSGMTSTDEVWGAVEASTYLHSVPCTFDSNLPWSSWSVTLPWETIAYNITRLYPALGTLKTLTITRKSQSGAVTALTIATDEGSAEVTGEYEVRQILSPAGSEIQLGDGSTTPGGTLLPSAYFTMEITPGQTITITGAGYGHGVGMSQNAANEMAKEGYTYEEILNYFFQDITITKS
jgi:stage II sporulation protein D